jgi:L-asparaginase type I
MSALPHLRVLYTGGTIGMVDSARGFVPAVGALAQRLAVNPRFHVGGPGPLTLPASTFGAGATYEIVEWETPLDSSNIGAEEWVRMAEDIAANLDRCDGFVVLHGTDTMAYTAAALSFMLENLPKPVIVTGSQVPLGHLRNDAVDNLLGALLLTAHHRIPEVGVYFRDRLWRGNRVQKVDAVGFDAFHAGNHAPLAEVGIGMELHPARWLPTPTAPFRLAPITERHVLCVRLHPGLTGDLLDRLLQPPLHGLVLETYGAGNAPDRDAALLDALRRANARGLVSVSVTQCHRGRVGGEYAAGRALLDTGVVPGGDLTPEAALVKLAWWLSQTDDVATVRAGMQAPQRGEMSGGNVGV